MRDPYFSVLAQSELFKDMEYEQIDAIVEAMSPRFETHKKSTIMRREGDAVTDTGMLLAGRAYLSVYRGGGERRIMELLAPGDLYGNISFFSSPDPRWISNLVAKTDCVLLSLDCRYLAEGGPMDPETNYRLLHNLIRSLSRRTLAILNAMHSLWGKSIRGRIAHFLLSEQVKQGGNAITLPLNRDELADFLAIPRPSLSRELSNMRRDGLIQLCKKQVIILNAEQLRIYI